MGELNSTAVTYEGQDPIIMARVMDESGVLITPDRVLGVTLAVWEADRERSAGPVAIYALHPTDVLEPSLVMRDPAWNRATGDSNGYQFRHAPHIPPGVGGAVRLTFEYEVVMRRKPRKHVAPQRFPIRVTLRRLPLSSR